MEITAPASVAGPCTAAPASFGPVITQAGVDGTAIVGTDDSSDGSSPTDGCSPFDNAGCHRRPVGLRRPRHLHVRDQDGRTPTTPGALGIVVGDNVSGRRPDLDVRQRIIYGVMVTLEDGAKFKSAGGPVSFHIAAVPADTDNTYRWLSGESDPAFGGAIRDLWNPNCYGDPGKVSDEEYHCDDDDHGGVHTNSGVVNRTFAILVDGLPGKVEAIGIDKAAWLFWYTQTHFLTPTSYFPDLADGLEASCAALQGVALDKVTVGNPSRADGADGVSTPAEVIGRHHRQGLQAGSSDGDQGDRSCGSTRPSSATSSRSCSTAPAPPSTAVTARTRRSPTRRTSRTVSPAGPRTRSSRSPKRSAIPWEASESAPGGHEGGVAFGPDPLSTGDCGGGSNDISSRNGLISPDITVPDGAVARDSRSSTTSRPRRRATAGT